MKTTPTQTAVKTIDVNAKQWFDKVNGNSYFAGVVTVNYGMQDEQSFKMPFQYGYGSQYEQEARQILFDAGLTTTTSDYELRNSGIIIRANIHTNCKKAELKAI